MNRADLFLEGLQAIDTDPYPGSFWHFVAEDLAVDLPHIRVPCHALQIPHHNEHSEILMLWSNAKETSQP